MTISLGSNIASLRTIRELGEATAGVAVASNRLASGLRINNASDDAAGLAVSSSLNVDARVYNLGVRNLNDGISYLNIADGAIGSFKSILLRLRELSTESSNGTYSNTQRQALDKESQALIGEYNRTVRVTSFNGTSIFAPTNSSLTIQVGYGTLTGQIGGTSSGSVNFQAPQTDATGTDPISVATADFNGDGKLDIVSADFVSSTASVLLGNGDGTFQTRQALGTGAGPRSVAAADFNGDGKSDIVSADQFDDTVSVLLGNGDGSFQAEQTYATGNFSSPYSLTTGDFNGDGKLDIVSADNGSNTVSVLLGNGDGTFQTQQAFGTGFAPESVAAADFNGDGKLDIISADALDNTVSVLLGNGDGTFQTRQAFGTGNLPQSVAAADFNGDGKLDIVSADNGSNTVSVLLGNGDGTFQTRQALGGVFGLESVAAADFNGDGKLDIISAPNGVRVLLGNGDGTFQAPQAFGPGTAVSVASADLNGDGKPDILTANSDNTVGVLLNSTTVSASAGITNIGNISVATRSGALAAQDTIDSILEAVNVTEGIIGSVMSRFTTAMANLQQGADNFKAAESRIVDTDVAVETSQLTREKILQQFGASVLAQANQEPALALKLLQ